MKVLIVQEKQFLSAALKYTLASKVYSLVFSSDFSNAQTVVANSTPSVLIADITATAGMSYITEAVSKKIPVIVISENGKEEDLQRAFDLGAADYASLPISLQELALRITILAQTKAGAAA
jgi:DNA-binding response OmpR family regulator